MLLVAQSDIYLVLQKCRNIFRFASYFLYRIDNGRVTTTYNNLSSYEKSSRIICNQNRSKDIYRTSFLGNSINGKQRRSMFFKDIRRLSAGNDISLWQPRIDLWPHTCLHHTQYLTGPDCASISHITLIGKNMRISYHEKETIYCLWFTLFTTWYLYDMHNVHVPYYWHFYTMVRHDSDVIRSISSNVLQQFP